MLWGPDIESEAEAILVDEGFPLDEPPDVEKLAWCALGAQNVVEARGLPVPGRFLPDSGRLELRPGLTRKARRWLLAHELSERHLLRRSYAPDEIEQLADAVAAALIAPKQAVRTALRSFGRHLPNLALVLGTTQSIAALRLGEVTGSPLALVTPRHVHVRGEEFGWPSERAVRALASGAVPEELVRLEVTDAARRCVLRAA